MTETRRLLIERAMMALKVGVIALVDYNEILYITLGLANFTVNNTVYKFFVDSNVPCVPESVGWYIDIPKEKAEESEGK